MPACAWPPVLLLHAVRISFANDVKAMLDGTSAFAMVDLSDAKAGTPSLATLQAHEAVLVFSDSGWQNATALGDNLAAYFNEGGNVVVAVFANTESGVSQSLGGLWNTLGYDLIPVAQYTALTEDATLGFNEPDSPLLVDVTSLTAVRAFQSPGIVSPTDTVVATWGSGVPLIVRGMRNGRNMVALNFYPPSSRAQSNFWDYNTGSGAAIMRNALLY
jgi:hypothetical protein